MSSRGDFNRARVFEVIHLYEPISRSDIAQRLDLTTAAISKIVAELIDRGVVTELGRRSSPRGQPAIELGVQADSAYTLGLHFEHGSITGVVADLKGAIVARSQQLLSPLPQPSDVLDTLKRTGSQLLKQVDTDKLLGVGLASVGPLDLQAGCVMRTDYTREWDAVSLRDPLASAFNLPVYMDNNATAGAIGEYWYGVGRSYRNFLYVGFYNMGVGGGLILDRRVYRGTGLNAAEFGHMLVNEQFDNETVLPILEHRVSGYALKRDLGEDIFTTFEQRLHAHDPDLCQWLDQASRAFSSAIVSVDHLLDLDTIIVGGLLPSAFFTELLKRVERDREKLYMRGWTRRSVLQTGQIGEGSAVLGAATLPVYDAFSPGSRVHDSNLSLFVSSGAGGDMH